MTRSRTHKTAVGALTLLLPLATVIPAATAEEGTAEPSVGSSWCLTPAFNRALFAQPLRTFDGIVTEVDAKNHSVKVATELVTLAPDKDDAQKMVPKKQTKIVKMPLAVTGSVLKVTSVTASPSQSDPTAKATTTWHGEGIDLAELQVGQQVSVTAKLPAPKVAQAAQNTLERRLMRLFGPLQIEEAAAELTAQTISFRADEAAVNSTAKQ